MCATESLFIKAAKSLSDSALVLWQEDQVQSHLVQTKQASICTQLIHVFETKNKWLQKIQPTQLSM